MKKKIKENHICTEDPELSWKQILANRSFQALFRWVTGLHLGPPLCSHCCARSSFGFKAEEPHGTMEPAGWGGPQRRAAAAEHALTPAYLMRAWRGRQQLGAAQPRALATCGSDGQLQGGSSDHESRRATRSGGGRRCGLGMWWC
jgi:hypothetical protein